jgi:hypothetical protein
VLEKHGQRKQSIYRKVRVAESASARSPDAAKIIAYCSRFEPDKAYSQDDFRGITGLKAAALKELIDKLQKEGWLAPSQKCKICFLFVNKGATGANEGTPAEG